MLDDRYPYVSAFLADAPLSGRTQLPDDSIGRRTRPSLCFVDVGIPHRDYLISSVRELLDAPRQEGFWLRQDVVAPGERPVSDRVRTVGGVLLLTSDTSAGMLGVGTRQHERKRQT
jgi:hypothetical protein